ncbi:membrane protein [Salmonella enterica subsp. arizonae]|nr:membrane protein [Salmonella enterica subsp. arizonae]
MTITDLVLILFIAALLAYALYDQFIMPRRNGPHSAFYSPASPWSRRQRYLCWAGRHPYL